jgi:hydrogenase nickel incorporation protein HypA/HybF
MHELAVCQALLAEVASVARRRGAPAVTDIHVGIGPLSGVEADLLRDAFPIAAAGTVAETATLYIRRTPVTVRCSECGKETEARANRLLCGNCGDWRTRLTSGDELLLERVGMETRPGELTTGDVVNV